MITDHYHIASSKPYSYLTNLLITPTHRSATNQQLTLATNSTVVSWCNLFLCEKTIPSPHIISIGNVVEISTPTSSEAIHINKPIHAKPHSANTLLSTQCGVVACY